MVQRTTGSAGAQEATLSGVYTVTGFTGRSLSRIDGLTLTVNDTKRRTLGPGDSARYVSVTTGLRSEYAGNLYGPRGLADARATAELDGCQFQHRATGIRYCITQTETQTYTVTPVAKAGDGT